MVVSCFVAQCRRVFGGISTTFSLARRRTTTVLRPRATALFSPSAHEYPLHAAVCHLSFDVRTWLYQSPGLNFFGHGFRGMNGAFPSLYGKNRAVRGFRVQKGGLSSDFGKTIEVRTPVRRRTASCPSSVFGARQGGGEK